MLMAAITLVEKHLTKTDVRHRLAFPTPNLHLLPAFEEGANWVEVPVRVKEKDGVEGFKPHVLCCVVRRRGPPKPVLERGWTRIVREKHLKPGDSIHLYIDAHVGDFILEFHRTIRLMGRDISAAI